MIPVSVTEDKILDTLKEASILKRVDSSGTCWSSDLNTVLCVSAVIPELCENKNGGCDHFCNVVRGHVQCSCADGYFLASDDKSCHSNSKRIYMFCFCIIPTAVVGHDLQFYSLSNPTGLLHFPVTPDHRRWFFQ